MYKFLHSWGKFHFNLFFLLSTHLAFYFYFVQSKILLTDREYQMAVVLLVSLTLQILLWNFMLTFVRHRWFRALLNGSFVASFLLLLGYRAVRGVSLDFSLIATNFSELFSSDGLSTVYEAAGVGWMLVMAVFCILAVFETRWGLFSRVYGYRSRRLALAALLALNCAAFYFFDRPPNESLVFARSVFRFMISPESEAMRVVDSPEPYPFLHQQIPAIKLPASERPHIFLLMMESWSGEMIESKTADGREITPFFNSLLSKGIYHSSFFSNSMQTERGHTSTLCSIIPSYRRKVMTTYFENHFRCLPQILQEAGYRTLFAQAQSNLSYDNTGNFMPKIGFQDVISMDERFVSEGEKTNVWGWGLQDNLFYQKVFKFLEDKRSEKNKRSPYFITLATISNHQGFDEMPEDQKYLFPEPHSYGEAFQNSMNLADHYLKEFFAQLEKTSQFNNSLIVILGDHGFPTGARPNNSNEMSFYNELFDVPLLILGHRLQKPFQFDPWRNGQIAYSQLDIAPSLLDWVGIKSTNAFRGEIIPLSAKKLPDRQHEIPLIQPYDGVYLMNLSYPWKYGLNLSSNEEFLFDVASDPRETKNLFSTFPERAAALSRGLEPIFLNQRLLEEDRLIPLALPQNP